MKLFYPLTAALLLTTLAPLPILRADEGHEMGDHHMEMKGPEERLDKLSEKLKLTDDQKSKVKTAMETRKTKMDALRDEMKSKMKATMEEYDASVLAVLNDDQKKTYNEMVEKRKAHMGKKKEEMKEKKEQKK